MRRALMILTVALGAASPAGAQWTTTCVRYSTRIRTCSARYVAAPAPARKTPTPAAHTAPAPIDLATLEEQDTVRGVWRASGVVFESHGQRTLLEARVTAAAAGGIHLEVPAAMGLPGGTSFDLARAGSGVYRATDRAGRVTTFRVAGGRAELLVTGTAGEGMVTFQFDVHEPPK